MPDLIAQGPHPEQRWRRSIASDQPFIIGRNVANWGVPWDSQVSRQHVQAQLIDGDLHVTKLENAQNPIFFRGQGQQKCSVTIGEHFVVGQTTFTLTAEQAHLTQELPRPDRQQAFDQDFLRKVRFRDPDRRIAALSRLPEMISSAPSDTELFSRVSNVILSGIGGATAIAIVRKNESNIDILHWDRRLVVGKDFQPSEKLISEGFESGESVLHIWNMSREEQKPTFTMDGEGDWALITPHVGGNNEQWALYVTGVLHGSHQSARTSSSDPDDLRDDVKFAELVGATLANIQTVKQLERKQSSLRPFFAPVVLDALAQEDPETVLSPRECEVSVLFCDLRGFTGATERHRDNLLELLNRVSQALGITTRNILDFGGVVGDFHGDAAMGFWGWPLAQDDSAQRVCKAALAIWKELEEVNQQSDHPLYGFRMGLGIATGTAVAGRIGTHDQSKVTVFGPVVNLASRLESMTRAVKASVLIDDRTAEKIKESKVADLRLRNVACVQPYGLNSSLELYQLLPSVEEYPLLDADHLQAYESALKEFKAGNWNETLKHLHRLPADDQVKDFLTIFIARHDRTPPPGWNGVIRFDQK